MLKLKLCQRDAVYIPKNCSVTCATQRKSSLMYHWNITLVWWLILSVNMVLYSRWNVSTLRWTLYMSDLFFQSLVIQNTKTSLYVLRKNQTCQATFMCGITIIIWDFLLVPYWTCVNCPLGFVQVGFFSGIVLGTCPFITHVPVNEHSTRSQHRSCGKSCMGLHFSGHLHLRWAPFTNVD